MSSFQFPANPSDGDIVVRGNLQAFYNAATNTWRVSEVPTAPGIPGPPGPPGPQGDPGQGATIVGVVDTFGDLPAPNAHQYELWVADDTNTLYWSDGLTWSDFGSPIQGEDGQGWTSVTENSTSSTYSITFNSDTPELQFTTPNLKGQDGAPGADGDDALGDVAYLGFDFSDGTNQATFGQQGPFQKIPWISTEQKEYTMPADCDAALVWWQASTVFNIGNAGNYTDGGFTSGQTVVFRSYLQHYLTLENATVYTNGGTQSGKKTYHNWNGTYSEEAAPDPATGEPRSSLQDRYTSEAFVKLELIEFTKGATVKFQIDTDINDMSTGEVSLGGCRAVVLPFNKDTNTGPIQRFLSQYTFEEEANAPSPEDMVLSRKADLKNRISEAIKAIDALLVDETDPAVTGDLKEIKTNILNVRETQGTFIQLKAALETQIKRLNRTYLNKPFAFE